LLLLPFARLYRARCLILPRCVSSRR
jgi:hypothetical protein